MSASSTIEHSGIVESISSGGIRVKFTAFSACASCHAKGYCSASEMEEKEISIQNYTGNYQVGEKVNIIMARALATKALTIGYIFPFLLIVILLLGLSAMGINELQAGIISLTTLLPYYLLIYLFRNKIERKFIFSIRKYNYV